MEKISVTFQIINLSDAMTDEVREMKRQQDYAGSTILGRLQLQAKPPRWASRQLRCICLLIEVVIRQLINGAL